MAAVKLPYLCQQLGEIGDVKVVSTESARHFMTSSAPVPRGPGLEYLNVSCSACNLEPCASARAKEQVIRCLICSPSSAPAAILQDVDEWHRWKHVGDDVLHIELRRFGGFGTPFLTVQHWLASENCCW